MEPLDWKYTICTDMESDQKLVKLYFVISTLFLGYFLPAGIALFLHISIWRHVENIAIPEGVAQLNYMNFVVHAHRNTRNRLIRHLSFITISFFISWLPLYVLQGYVVLVDGSGNNGAFNIELISVLMPLAQWLGLFNSCLNPVLYVLFNKVFRNALRTPVSSFRLTRPSI